MLQEALREKVIVERIVFSDSLLKTSEGASLYEIIIDFHNSVYMPQNLFNGISNVENSQGILALVRFQQNMVESVPEEGVLIYLDGIQDPGNMGTIIRSADAFGIRGVVLGAHSVDPYNPKVVRATMGSVFRVPIYSTYKEEEVDPLNWKKKRRVIAAELDNSISLNKVEFRQDDIIVIGNEGKGVSEEVLSRASLRMIIPMSGNAESLNAGVAASIIMYETNRQLTKLVEF